MKGQIIKDLKRDEGFVPHAYQDHLGYWTLGYGFLVDERKGGIPDDVAEYWLDRNVDMLIASLRAALPCFDEYPEGVRRALCNMCYQLGLSGLLNFRDTLSLLNEGKYTEAADEALNSKWANQTPNRAKRVTGWMRA